MHDNSLQVAIVVLNWNGWKDTIECLDSIFRSSYPNFQVIVCDNASTDDSISNILSWAKGERKFILPEMSPIRNKPGSEIIPEKVFLSDPKENWSTSNNTKRELFIVPIKTNKGYAGGNNIGIKMARSNKEIDYVWLLNNDTVVAPPALAELVIRARKNRNIGICGSTIRYYDEPDFIQTLGGCTYNKWIASSKYITPNQMDSNLDELRSTVEERMRMVLGASMFVSMEFINEVGLLSEDYFLFAEEIDWSTRAENIFPLGFAPRSVIYHKKGKSTGSSKNPKERTSITDYYNIRSRLIFTQKYYPWSLPTVYLSLIPMMINRLRRGQFDRASVIFNLALASLINPKKIFSSHHRHFT